MNKESVLSSKVGEEKVSFFTIWHVGSWQRFDCLEQALSNDTSAPFLVEMDDPAWNLAERLALGGSLEAACFDWEKDFKRLRDAWRKRRKTFTLVGRSKDGTIDRGCIATICERLGVSSIELIDCELGQNRKSSVTATLRLVADSMLVAEPTMGTLADELRAAMISPCKKTLNDPTIVAALNEHRNMQAENSLLRDTLVANLELVSTTESNCKSLKAEVSKLREVQNSLEAEVSKLREVRNSLEAEASKLREVGKGLEATVKSDAARIASLTRETDALKANIADLKASSSWRITAPLRRVRTALSAVQK